MSIIEIIAGLAGLFLPVTVYVFLKYSIAQGLYYLVQVELLLNIMGVYGGYSRVLVLLIILHVIWFAASIWIYLSVKKFGYKINQPLFNSDFLPVMKGVFGEFKEAFRENRR